LHIGGYAVTIPINQTVRLPLLSLAEGEEEHRLRDAIEELADHFNLIEDLKERIAK
jgi:restriction endonuclease Mrr